MPLAPTTPRRHRRALWAAAAAVPAALAAAPALAGAVPAIATDAICLRPSQQATGGAISPPLNVTGSGFSPNALVTINRGARPELVRTDALGNFAAQLSVLDLLSDDAPRSRPLDISAADPVLGPSNPLRVRTAALAFSARPKRTKPSNTVTFKLSGFTPDQPVYAHYRFNGRLRATVRMGVASNPCGLLTARRDQIPVKDPQIGLWNVQFSQSKTFKKRSIPRIDATVNVFQTTRRR